MHIRVRRGAHAVGLAEFPLIFGLITLDPVVMLATRVVGGTIGLAGPRRQRGGKLSFNVALVALQAAVAAGDWSRVEQLASQAAALKRS